MKKFAQYISGVAILVVAIPFFGSSSKVAVGNVQINFANFVGNVVLTLDDAHYKNNLAQDFTVTNFKYYIGKIHLKNDKGKEYVSDKYYLIKADDLASQQFELENVPSGKYVSMSFTLGVDSIDNCSGAQSGSLDPVNAMFWSWNTGYIFLKLEGKSPDSKSNGNIFEYHIGGYQAPNNCIRKITIDMKNKPLRFTAGNFGHIAIKADAAEVLKSPVDIDFSKLSSVTDFHNATMIADNYKDMFSLLEVEYADGK